MLRRGGNWLKATWKCSMYLGCAAKKRFCNLEGFWCCAKKMWKAFKGIFLYQVMVVVVVFLMNHWMVLIPTCQAASCKRCFRCPYRSYGSYPARRQWSKLVDVGCWSKNENRMKWGDTVILHGSFDYPFTGGSNTANVSSFCGIPLSRVCWLGW